MRLRAIEMPIETPTPTTPPETAAEAAATRALIDDVSVAVTVTSPVVPVAVVVTWLPAIEAVVCVRITLVAAAPAPLTAKPTVPPPAANDAAIARLSIADPLVALIETAPARTPPTVPSAFAVTPEIPAVTALSIVFIATVTAIDIAAPTVPAIATASEAPIASARIDESSEAVSVTVRAWMPRRVCWALGTPVMVAATSVTIVLIAADPAPLAPTPTVPEPAIAAEAATTRALMRWRDVAVWVSAPVAETEVRSRYARTSSGWRVPLEA